MASYYPRKDSPYYWIRFQRPDGTWGNKASTVRTDADSAIRSINQFVAQHTLREVNHSDNASEHRFTSWVPGFLRQRYRNATTLRRYLNAWSALETYLDHRQITSPVQVKHQICTDYPAFRTNPPARLLRPAAHNTALMEIKVLTAILQEALRRGYIDANPCVRLGIKKAPPKAKREIMADEIAIIESALVTREQWMRDCWLVAMLHGCRYAETAVPLANIDTHAMLITFRIKGGRDHTTSLSPGGQRQLEIPLSDN